MIRKSGMVTVNPFSEAWKRKMNTKPAGPVYFGPFEVTSQVFLSTPHSFALVNLKPLLPGHVLVCPHKPHKRLTDLSAPELTDLFQAVQRVQRMLARHYFSPSPSPSPSSSSPHPAPAAPPSSSSSAATPTPAPAPAEPEDGSFNIAVQDGAGAGQTVPHVHVHVIPRIAGATEKDEATIGDAVYEHMASEEGNVGGALWDREVIAAAAKSRNGSLPPSERPVPGGGFASIEDASRQARSMEEMVAEAELFRGVLAAMARDELRGEKEGGGRQGSGGGEEGAAGNR